MAAEAAAATATSTARSFFLRPSCLAHMADKSRGSLAACGRAAGTEGLRACFGETKRVLPEVGAGEGCKLKTVKTISETKATRAELTCLCGRALEVPRF